MYGGSKKAYRIFFFPLKQLTATIKHDLHLTTAQIANSNIVSLCATYDGSPVLFSFFFSSSLSSIILDPITYYTHKYLT